MVLSVLGWHPFLNNINSSSRYNGRCIYCIVKLLSRGCCVCACHCLLCYGDVLVYCNIFLRMACVQACHRLSQTLYISWNIVCLVDFVCCMYTLHHTTTLYIFLSLHVVCAIFILLLTETTFCMTTLHQFALRLCRLVLPLQHCWASRQFVVSQYVKFSDSRFNGFCTGMGYVSKIWLLWVTHPLGGGGRPLKFFFWSFCVTV